MEGDGYTVALHCPNVEAYDREPDSSPLHCQEECGNCFEGKTDLYHPCRKCNTLIK